MEGKVKRPVAVWIVMVLIVANAVSVFVGIYRMIDLFNYYSIPLSTVIERFGTRWGIAAATGIAGLASVVLIWRRSEVGRWLAIGSFIVLILNYLFFQIADPPTTYRSPENAENAVVYVLSLTVAVLPTFVLIALLTIGKGTNEYFRGPQPKAPDTRPPPPPVFEI